MRTYQKLARFQFFVMASTFVVFNQLFGNQLIGIQREPAVSQQTRIARSTQNFTCQRVFVGKLLKVFKKLIQFFKLNIPADTQLASNKQPVQKRLPSSDPNQFFPSHKRRLKTFWADTVGLVRLRPHLQTPYRIGCPFFQQLKQVKLVKTNNSRQTLEMFLDKELEDIQQLLTIRLNVCLNTIVVKNGVE